MLTQSINTFKNSMEIKWIIDDVKSTEYDIKAIAENEISITDDKTVLYDISLYSNERIIKEISDMACDGGPKPISDEVRKKIKIHPKIWIHVAKMWQYYYNNNVKDLLSALPLKANIEEFTRLDQHKFLSGLSLEDSLIIVKDLIENPEVKRDKNSKWNIYGDFIREWRPQLLSYLRENGIEYDEENKTFSLVGGEPIQILTSVRKLSRYLEIEFDDYFYNNLRDEINSTYKFGTFTSTMFLSRKLLENLVIDVLRKKFPASVETNLGLYFSASQGRFHDFNILLKNLEEKKAGFGVDKDIITEFISLIKPFRPRVNSSTHSIFIVGTEDELLTHDVPKMAALLLRLHKNI